MHRELARLRASPATDLGSPTARQKYSSRLALKIDPVPPTSCGMAK